MGRMWFSGISDHWRGFVHNRVCSKMSCESWCIVNEYHSFDDLTYDDVMWCDDWCLSSSHTAKVCFRTRDCMDISFEKAGFAGWTPGWGESVCGQSASPQSRRAKVVQGGQSPNKAFNTLAIDLHSEINPEYWQGWNPTLKELHNEAGQC